MDGPAPLESLTETAAVGDPPDGLPTQHRKRRRRLILSFVGPLLIIGLLAYLLAIHGGEVRRAAARVSLVDLIVVTLLAMLTLLARTECVVACLNAMGNRPRRIDIHSANSLT